jgi:demethoxyubiquinone hydroxylase (CLK1/Coq7/Cat5 family)
VLEEIVRVDQAGELGANYIYYGQHAVLSLGRDTKVTELVQVRFSSFFPLFPSVSLLYSH